MTGVRFAISTAMFTSVRLLAAALAASAAVAALTAVAHADDEPLLTVYWDHAQFSKGQPFRAECESGSYLIGFEGRAGAWVDTMRIVCARWDAERNRFQNPAVVGEGQIAYSRGGEHTREVCPAGDGIAGDYDEHYARDGSSYILHTLEFYCVRATDGTRPIWRKFGSTWPLDKEYDRAMPHAGCPEGYLATGVYGRAGQFVDRFFGFVCRRRPFASPVAEAKPPSRGSATRAPGKSRTSMGNVSDMIAGGGTSVDTSPPPPPPLPPVDMVRVKTPTDVYRQTAPGNFVRTDDDEDHFLPEGLEAQLLAKEGGWWKLALPTIPFAPNGEGWVWSGDLKLLPKQ
jgi:hypothetical protein